MDAEEDPKDLGGLGTGLDFFQVVVLLLLAKAALQSTGPFFGDGTCELPALFFVFAGPSLALEVGTDVIAAGEVPIFIGGVYGIGSGQSGFDLGQALRLKDSILEAVAFVEGLEAQVLDETNAVYLELIDLGPELYRFFLFPSYNGSDIVFVKTHNAGLRFYPFVKVSVLLAIDLPGCGPAPQLVFGHRYPILGFQAIQLIAKLI
jgi:hypothetical protein